MNTQTAGLTATAPLADADIAELDSLLQALPDAYEPLDAAMLDGFLVAVLLSPEPIAEATWLPFVLDDQQRAVAADAPPRLTELLRRRHNELAAFIAAREPFDPIIFELEDDAGKPLTGKAAIVALEPLAGGFVCAFDAFPSLLDAMQAQEDGMFAVAAILRHLPVDADDDSAENQEFARDKAQLDADWPLADLDDAIDALNESVFVIADITRPRRPLTRDEPKVGRNDPCPCGSGRKFKQCHGHTTEH